MRDKSESELVPGGTKMVGTIIIFKKGNGYECTHFAGSSRPLTEGEIFRISAYASPSEIIKMLERMAKAVASELKIELIIVPLGEGTKVQ